MREIKFRAWERESKIMHTVDSICFPMGTPSGKDITVPAIGEDGVSEWLSIDDVGLMQFTGLHDRNGKEIYEGDIMKAHLQESERIGTVVWAGHVCAGFHFSFGGRLWDDRDWEIDGGTFEEWEVIGNIYENPDLLNQ